MTDFLHFSRVSLYKSTWNFFSPSLVLLLLIPSCLTSLLIQQHPSSRPLRTKMEGGRPHAMHDMFSTRAEPSALKHASQSECHAPELPLRFCYSNRRTEILLSTRRDGTTRTRVYINTQWVEPIMAQVFEVQICCMGGGNNCCSVPRWARTKVA